jgi:hypothetical protein
MCINRAEASIMGASEFMLVGAAEIRPDIGTGTDLRPEIAVGRLIEGQNAGFPRLLLLCLRYGDVLVIAFA